MRERSGCDHKKLFAISDAAVVFTPCHFARGEALGDDLKIDGTSLAARRDEKG
jgi:hypothetical protein